MATENHNLTNPKCRGLWSPLQVFVTPLFRGYHSTVPLRNKKWHRTKRQQTEAPRGQSKDTICGLFQDWEHRTFNFPHRQSPGTAQCYKTTLSLCQEGGYWPRVETKTLRLGQPLYILYQKVGTVVVHAIFKHFQQVWGPLLLTRRAGTQTSPNKSEMQTLSSCKKHDIEEMDPLVAARL